MILLWNRLITKGDSGYDPFYFSGGECDILVFMSSLFYLD